MRNSALKSTMRDIWRIPRKTITKAICFTGDDGYEADHDKIMMLCEKHKVPYTFAIQGNNVGKAGFMNHSQMLECADSPYISFALHCMDDTRMGDVTPDELNTIYDAWYSFMCERGYIDPGYTAPIFYNHGELTDIGINETVQYRTMCGARTAKGINYTPFDRFKFLRNGLFPSDGGYTITQAKSDINSLVNSAKSGIIVFMTHSNTDTFDISQLEELMLYAKASGIPVMHISEAMEAIEPYFIPDRPIHTWTEQTITLYSGVSRLSAWNTTNPAKLELNISGSSVMRLAQPIEVTGAKFAKITGYTSAYYCKYAFYKDNPTQYMNLIRYANFPSSVSGTNGNFTSEIVTVPSNAKYLVISGTDQGGGRNMPACSLDYGEESTDTNVHRPKSIFNGEDIFITEDVDAPTPIS